ncbi:MAG: helix-turn-helix transcriptional regulator [Fibrobacter sp.]|nr:helix-turn-helix transcriptional regulator [Fibrobacter sp.]
MIIIPLLFKKDLVLFPGKTDLEFTSYSDSINVLDTTSTSIHRFDTDSKFIALEYTIGKKNLYPYAGFQWIVKENQPYLNISKYDHVTVAFDPATTEDVIVLILQFFTDGFSTNSNRLTWRFLSKEIPMKKGKKVYTIPISEFKTPLWWYNQFNITEKDLSPVDFSKLAMVSVEDGSDAIGKRRSIILTELRFQKKNALAITGLLIVALLLYYAIYLLSFWLKRYLSSKKSPQTIPYEKLSIENDAADEEKKVLEYLGSNFSNQNLSLFRMSEEIGISSNKISAIIKKRYNLTFRQYLNTIRIAESKRLLQETKLQISQIAYRVGYTNLTHFCRTFKEVTSVSPNTFRQDFAEVHESENLI